MQKKKTLVFILVLAAVLLLFLGAWLLYRFLSPLYVPDQLSGGESTEAASDGRSRENDHGGDSAAPDFSAENEAGETVRLSDYMGIPLVLNFWASWCPPCREEMPHFDKISSSRNDVRFLMVNLTDGSRETRETAVDFLRENGYSFPVLFDVGSEGAYAYGVSSIPCTFFIDKSGNVVTYAVGSISEETLLKGISMIIEP